MNAFTMARRRLVQAAAALAVAPAGLTAAAPATPATSGSPQPVAALTSVLDAFDHYPLVALGEHHQLQEFHDFLTALIVHPDFPMAVNDVVVEFGNALYQEVADRFVVAGDPVANAELEPIWRNTIGGGVLWDAPVYGQFFRNLRAVNWRLPPEQRIRVLLGDPPVDFGALENGSDHDPVPTESDRDPFYAGVVERDVLAKGRKALLIAGGPHLRRGLSTNVNPNQANAATLIAEKHRDSLFAVDVLPLNPGWASDEVLQRLQTEFAEWPRPSFAVVAGTWLGAESMPHRAVDPASIYEQQVDAVLWLGPDDTLTASRADPTIYQCGDYAAELQRRGEVLSQIEGQPTDLISLGLQMAQDGPGWPGTRAK
jgi:hypothetical protein